MFNRTRISQIWRIGNYISNHHRLCPWCGAISPNSSSTRQTLPIFFDVYSHILNLRFCHFYLQKNGQIGLDKKDQFKQVKGEDNHAVHQREAMIKALLTFSHQLNPSRLSKDLSRECILLSIILTSFKMFSEYFICRFCFREIQLVKTVYNIDPDFHSRN